MIARELEIRVNNEDIHISFTAHQTLDEIANQVEFHILPAWIAAGKHDFVFGDRKFRVSSKRSHPEALLGNFPMSRPDYWIFEL